MAGVRLGRAVRVLPGVLVWLGLAVALGRTVGLAVALGEAVGVSLGRTVGLFVALGLLVAVAVGLGLGAQPRSNSISRSSRKLASVFRVFLLNSPNAFCKSSLVMRVSSQSLHNCGLKTQA